MRYVVKLTIFTQQQPIVKETNGKRENQTKISDSTFPTGSNYDVT